MVKERGITRKLRRAILRGENIEGQGPPLAVRRAKQRAQEVLAPDFSDPEAAAFELKAHREANGRGTG